MNKRQVSQLKSNDDEIYSAVFRSILGSANSVVSAAQIAFH